MKSKVACLGILVLGVLPVHAEYVRAAPGDTAYEEAITKHLTALDEIAANREAVIEEIVAMWFMDEPGWEEQFRSTLDSAHDSQLLAILDAESYVEVKAILGDETFTLGDTDKDMVFTPVTPCWAVDTRLGGGGFIPAGTVRNYNVYGNLVGQGGSNCPAPRGEPRAVLLNVIAVNPDGKGNLNVVPFGVDPKTQGALSVNFNVTAGTNLANTGIIKTAYLGAADISLSANYSGCHAVISVLGYYYPVDETDFKVKFAGSRSGSFTSLPSMTCTNHADGQVSIYVPGSGKIMVTAQAFLGLKNHVSGSIDRILVYIGSSPNDCTAYNSFEGYNTMGWLVPAAVGSFSSSDLAGGTVTVSRTFTVTSAGTKTYYLNGRKDMGSGNGGVYGSSMQAVYYPDR